MTAPRDLPLSGYSIEKVYAVDLELRDQRAADDESTHGEVNVGWDWRLLDQNRLEVKLKVTVEPTAERDEFISATMIARFATTTDTPSVPIPEFAQLQAPAILLPYVRSALSSLTVLSIYGAYYLPSINVVAMMKDFDRSKATGVAQLRQLQEATLVFDADVTPSGQRSDRSRSSSSKSRSRKTRSS